MQGRKSKPTALKLLAGNPGKRPINSSEPQYPPLPIEVPEELAHERNAIARAEWDRVVPLMVEAGVAKRIDRAAMIAYCLAYQQWIVSENSIRDTGMFVRSNSGWVTVNPHMKTSQVAWERMKAIFGEFGMTPSARVNLKAQIPAEEVDPMEAFLKKRDTA